MSRKVTNKAMGGTVYMGLILLHINKLDTNQKREKKTCQELWRVPRRRRHLGEVVPWFMWTNPLGLSTAPHHRSRAHGLTDLWCQRTELGCERDEDWGGAGRGRGSYTRRSQIYETASIPYLTLEVVHEGDAKKARQSDS